MLCPWARPRYIPPHHFAIRALSSWLPAALGIRSCYLLASAPANSIPLVPASARRPWMLISGLLVALAVGFAAAGLRLPAVAALAAAMMLPRLVPPQPTA